MYLTTVRRGPKGHENGYEARLALSHSQIRNGQYPPALFSLSSFYTNRLSWKKLKSSLLCVTSECHNSFVDSLQVTPSSEMIFFLSYAGI